MYYAFYFNSIFSILPYCMSIGYLTRTGKDISNVFMNINGAPIRRSGSFTSAGNIYITQDVPVLIVAYADVKYLESGMFYANAFFNNTTSKLYVQPRVFTPTVATGKSPFSSVTPETNFNYIVVTPKTSGAIIYWFEIVLNAQDTGLITSDLDLTKIFKNINGYSTHSSGSYVNSTTSRTITIPSSNIPYQFVANSLGTNCGMINAYVYHSITASGGGVSLISKIGTALFSTVEYNIGGTITLTTSETNADIIYYNFNTLY